MRMLRKRAGGGGCCVEARNLADRRSPRIGTARNCTFLTSLRNDTQKPEVLLQAQAAIYSEDLAGDEVGGGREEERGCSDIG